MRFRSILACLAAACACAAVQATGVQERRLAAELVIMAGDTRRAMTGEGGSLEREGLVERLNGALSSLPLLLRRANENTKPVAAMRDALVRKNWPAFSATIATFRQRHPFDARTLIVTAPTPEMLSLGAAIHRATCAGCHDAPSGDSLLPAKNLSAQLKSMSREEFAARLLLSVRGDRTTSWANPFGDLELAALIAFYSTSR